MKKALAAFAALASIASLFQNCSATLQPAAPSPVVAAEQASVDGGESVNAAAATQPQSVAGGGAKLGVNFGTFGVQGVVDKMGDYGGWYYNYSPYPDRADKTTYATVAWANARGKEFVPMVSGGQFKLGAGTQTCPLTAELASAGQTVCSLQEMTKAITDMKKLFKSGNQPRFLIGFNEPWSSGGKLTDPKAAARAWARLQAVADGTGLKLVSPTVSAANDAPVQWTVGFLKACYDLRAAAEPCSVDKLYAFAAHDYQCAESFWNQNYRDGGLQARLISGMGGYGGKDWSAFVRARKFWVTETNCNWDPDFLAAQAKGQFIRSQHETCVRATGQKSGFGAGSLAAMINIPVIERMSWWNTYADPATDSDIAAGVNDSSINRISAARMLDNGLNWTAAGTVVRQAYANAGLLKSVSCPAETAAAPDLALGLFKTPDGGIFFGMKDFYCRYGSVSALNTVYGAGVWDKLVKVVPARPVKMQDAGVCGAQQGLHRQNNAIFYTYKQGYTCWINSVASLAALTGYSGAQANQLPSRDLKALGLDAQAVSGRICQ